MKMKISGKTNIRDWYVSEFPTDELGVEINEKVVFFDLADCLDIHGDVYDVIGVGDSVIRERVFEGLSEIENIPYGEIYDRWLLCA